MGGTRCPLRFVVLAAALAAPLRAEIIGPWDISDAPVSAALVAGGGGAWDWLNVVNAPISVSTAFSGFSIIDDGYANGPAGTTVEMTFAPGVAVNGPGDDLVVFDGRYSVNSYAWSTSYDGFVAEEALPGGAFAFTGVVKSYFYGGGGPFSALVMAKAVDLSTLGVPLGASILKVRLRGTTTEVDPLGIGVLRGRGGQVPSVPEPGSLAFLGLGAAMALRRRRSRQA